MTKSTQNPMKNYNDIVLNSLPDRELEIVGSLTAEKMALMRDKAIAKIKESVEIDGFRKGNAPDAMIVAKFGEMAILEEASEIALSEEYPNILEEHNIDAIGRPEISITKIAPGNPLEFKIKTALMPEIKLADVKKIAQKENKTEEKNPEVTDGEVDAVIKNIQQTIAHQKMHEKSGNEHDHSHGDIKDEDLPEVTDEFAQMIGGFADVLELREKVKENISKEKEMKEKDKTRTKILEKIMEASTIELPKIIIEGEMEKMLGQFKDDIARSGISYEEYLKHIKKTEDNLRGEWKETAIKRAKSQVILNTIAKNEGITPIEDKVKKEMENILLHHKDADRFRVRMYVETFMTNELVFQFLENQK